MANYYTSFSAQLDINSEEEHAWLELVLQNPLDLSESELARWANAMNISHERAGPGLAAGDWDFWPAFDYSFEDAPGHNYLWIRHSDTGDPEDVGYLVSEFLARFRINECWAMEWAYSCSAPRPGAFSGGGMVVTGEQIIYIDVRQQIQKIISELEEQL